jgi:hypothetical protein
VFGLATTVQASAASSPQRHRFGARRVAFPAMDEDR